MLNLRNSHPIKKQGGFTLVEFMLSIALGMSVISSVLIGYLATYSGSVNTLAYSKLSLEMSTLMDLMITDIRRAGYSNNPTVGTTPANNAFNLVNNTAPEVYAALDATDAGSVGSGLCITYSYDANRDGAVGADELFGFRRNGGVVETRTTGDLADPDTCLEDLNNTWDELTDPDFMTVTALTFSLAQSACFNSREPDLVDNDLDGATDEAAEGDCYVAPLPAVNSRDITAETRQVDITLTASLASDAFVNISMTQSVRVRNELVRVR